MNLLITGACGHIGSYLAENIHKIKKILFLTTPFATKYKANITKKV